MIDLQILADPLFRLPFLAGLLLAVLLPVLGMYLRLRNEWLAALGLAQIASAGALVAAAFGGPVLAGGVGASLAAAALKGRFERAGESGYAIMLVLGWGVSVLLSANLPVAERVGHALFDGQLYLIGGEHLAAAAVLLAVALVVLRRLSRPLLLLRFFPEFFRARNLPQRRYGLVFDLLVAASLAAATVSVGVIAAFGLVFVPPWVAFRRAGNWRQGLLWASGFALVSYVTAFALALTLDQPFGPVCAITLIAAALASGAAPGGRGGRAP
jgi:zinc transport system permease protein